MTLNDDDEVFEVERILADDVVDEVTFYLVKWKNYGDEQCTWEPRESFTSEVSLREWEEQKAKGLGLPEEFLVEVQRKMDEFQAGSEQTNPVSDDSEPSESPVSDMPFAIDETKQHPVAESPTSGLENMHLDTAELTNDLTDTAHTNGSPGLRTKSVPSIPESSIKRRGRPLRSTNKNVNPLARKAGQRFRNLSHMNNYRKKSKAEPPPIISASRLRSAADLPRGPDTAHYLPQYSPVANIRNESPLFIPDSSTTQHRRSASPARSDDSAFPPARVDHVNKRPFQTIPLPRRTIEPAPYIQTAQLPHEDMLVRAKNGRTWYKGDIVCKFSVGRYIGDARIIHVDFRVWGSKIVELKEGPDLFLNFDSVCFTRQQFEDSYLNARNRPRCIGLIDAFEDQQSSFNLLASYLEDSDMATIFHHPNRDLSMLLYSYDARSWAQIGRRNPRPGSARARLHVAFFENLVPRKLEQSRLYNQTGLWSSSDDVNMQVSEVTDPEQMLLPARQRRSSLLGQIQTTPRSESNRPDPVTASNRTDSPDVDNKDAPAGYVDSPMTDAVSIPTSPAVMTPLSPTQFFATDKETTAPTKNVTTCAKPRVAGRVSSSVSQRGSSSKLSFLTLITSSNPKVKSDRRKARFFIGFSQSHPKESGMIQKWLETHTDATNVYLETERLGWKRFNQLSDNHMCVVLLHEKELGFQKLSGFAQSLFSDTFMCFSLAFSREASLDPLHTTTKRMFPRATTYLMTESAIVQNLDAAIQVMQYFDDNKKPEYRMLMRPKIIDWFLQSAREEANPKRKDKLIELLFLVRRLNPQTATPLGEEEEDIVRRGINAVDDEVSRGYVLSCDSLPGYPPIAFDEAPKPTDPRLNIPVLTMGQRDSIILSYFYAYAAVRAYRTRRFIAIVSPEQLMAIGQSNRKKEQDNILDCGHIMFYETEKFAHRYCGNRNHEKM